MFWKMHDFIDQTIVLNAKSQSTFLLTAFKNCYFFFKPYVLKPLKQIDTNTLISLHVKKNLYHEIFFFKQKI
jgi:hypothetical protein